MRAISDRSAVSRAILLSISDRCDSAILSALAGVVRLLREVQQFADRVDLESEFPRVPDEAQPAQIGAIVKATVAFGAWRRGQEPYRFVVADRRHLDAAVPRCLADGDSIDTHDA